MLPKIYKQQSRVAPKQSKSENRLCAHCNTSQPHNLTSTTATCQRCGAITHFWKRPMAQLENRLDLALGLIAEEADAPHPPKLEGEKKTSAKGAHRFDDGVKFVQMKYDDQFMHKGDYHTIKS